MMVILSHAYQLYHLHSFLGIIALNYDCSATDFMSMQNEPECSNGDAGSIKNLRRKETYSKSSSKPHRLACAQ